MKNECYEYGESYSSLVRQYMDLIDNKLVLPRIEFLKAVQVLLSRLYAASAELPLVEGSDPGDDFAKSSNSNSKRNDPDTKRFFNRAEKIKELLKEMDGYWHLFDPTNANEKNDPTCYAISLDLAEIYDDLTGGLELWDMADSLQKEEAIWHWQWNWQYHWGHHSLNALRAIHTHLEEYDPEQ